MLGLIILHEIFSHLVSEHVNLASALYCFWMKNLVLWSLDNYLNDCCWRSIYSWHHSFIKKTPLQAFKRPHFQASYQPYSGTTCTTIGSAFFGAATSAIPALFRHDLHHHLKCIFWGCNQRHFRRHTSPVQAPLVPLLEVHFFGLQPAPFQASYQPRSGTTCTTIGSTFFGAATRAISGAIPAPFRHHLQSHWKCHFQGCNQCHFKSHTNAVSGVFSCRQEVPFGSAVQALFATAESHQWGLACWWCW